MANEMRIYEKRAATAEQPGFDLCMFVYKTKFERNGIPIALTPLSGLSQDLVDLLSDTPEVGQQLSEQEQVEAGNLSWQLVRVLTPFGFDPAQRRQRIIEKYLGHRAQFRRDIVDTKLPTIEIINLPERPDVSGGIP